MQLHKLPGLIVLGCLLSRGAAADTLTFIAQPVSGGGIDYSWFNAANWFLTDSTGNLVPAGRVPLDTEQAIIIGPVDLQTGGVRVQSLVETNNASLTNGTLAVENLQLLSGSLVGNATVNVLSALTVQGTNCTLQNASLTIFAIAAGYFRALAPATSASLVLTQGSIFEIAGTLSLSDGSQINGGGLPQSKVLIQTGAVLSSTNSALVRGSANGHLILDNSGLVRVDGGALTFSDGMDWQSSAGTGEFRANSSSALLLFSNVFHADGTVIDLFTGPGTNRWLAGGSIDGIAQIAALDPNTQLAGPGNLETFGAVTGAGTIHAVGTTNQGGAVIWSDGTIGLAGLSVDPGANLLIPGGVGANRQLAGCLVTNLGGCTLGNAVVGFSQNATINNQTGATFIVQGQGVFTSTDGSGIFSNSGTLQMINPGTLQFGETNATAGPTFNNSGVVNLSSGQLSLLGGASSGEFHQAPGTLLWFWGNPYALNTGTTFTGSNTVRVAQGVAPATWLVEDGISISSLELGSNSVVDASGLLAGAAVQVGDLVAQDNGMLSNGTFQVQIFQMRDASSLWGSTVNIGSQLTVAGTNCSLSATALTLAPGATGLLQSPIGLPGARLMLAQGTVFQDGGQLILTDGSTIAGGGSPGSKLVIQAGGTLESTNSTTIQGSPGANLLVDNSGLIRADAGSLTLADGLTWQSSSGLGEFEAGVPGASLVFTGPFQVGSGIVSLFTGPGTNHWLGGVAIDGIAQVGASGNAALAPRPGNVEIACAAAGAGSLHVVGGSAPGNLFWANGTLSLKQLTVDAGGMLWVGGGAATSRQLSGCALNNAGSCTFIGGDLLLGTSAVINNLAGGSLLLQTNVTLALVSGSGTAALNNAGTLWQSASATRCVVGADFNNSGTLQLQGGTLSFQGSWNQTQGTTTVDPGGVLAGTNLTVTGGIITGGGAIDGTLINTGGTVSPGMAVGVLSTGPGSNFQQGGAGTLAVELGGTTPGSQYDQLAIGGAAQLGGQLQVRLLNGFVPAVGDSFQVLTCASESGQFAGIDAPPLAGNTWLTRYNGTNVTLTVAGSVLLSRPTVASGSLSFPVNTTPGIQYLVQRTSSLAPANWQTLSTFTGDGTVRIVSDAVDPSQGPRFYRVLMQ